MNNTITPAGNDFVVQPERKPTHFIELFSGKSTEIVARTDVREIHKLEDTLHETSRYQNLETIAIWKIYPKQ
jgi:hypothetical protein